MLRAVCSETLFVGTIRLLHYYLSMLVLLCLLLNDDKSWDNFYFNVSILGPIHFFR